MRSLRRDVGLALSVRRGSGAFAADFEQLEAERFDLDEHAGARVTAQHTNGVTTARTVRRDAEEMKFALALALAAAIATLGGAHLASAEWQTTQPPLVYTVLAVLTDKSIQLTHTRVPRGVVIRYTIVNHGSRPYVLQIWTRVTRPIPPKGRARLTVNWDFRGRFVYRTLYRGRPAGPHGSVTVV
jgi:hypothetical protein